MIKGISHVLRVHDKAVIKAANSHAHTHTKEKKRDKRKVCLSLVGADDQSRYELVRQAVKVIFVE